MSISEEHGTGTVGEDAGLGRVERLLGELTLGEKCKLLGGASNWRTHPIERLGIPAIKMSDGPNGIRGEGQGDDRTPTVLIPVGIVMGASWDPGLVRQLGDLLGRDALRKSVHVLLGPTVNLHRTPIGGRTFEAFSEDPELTAALAVQWVKGVQAHDVAITVKHFVGNDTEVDRHGVDVIVDERTLREMYLRPFEDCVLEADAWGVMSAYNRFAGEFCAENDRLLNQTLRAEWGFDGFVVSDWFGAHSTAPAANGGLSIEMPGPSRIYGSKLESAVVAGDVAAKTIDSLVREVLVLAERTNAYDRSADTPETSLDDPTDRALCHQAAVAGTVLLRNGASESDTAVLPINLGEISTLAVVGPNAEVSRSMGGGSSAVQPFPMLSILDAIRHSAAEADVVVTHEPGVRIDKHTPLPGADTLVGSDGQPGLELEFINGPDLDGPVTLRQRSSSSLLKYLGSAAPGVDANGFWIRIKGAYVAEVEGDHEFGGIVIGSARVTVDDTVLIDDPDRLLPRGDAFYGLGSAEVISTLTLQAGQKVVIDVETQVTNGFGGFRLGIRQPDPTDLLDRAVVAAAGSDLAVVVVGTNEEWETEGNDRDSIQLPGMQDELVRRVAAANPNTIVVVNAGSPVSMPWIDDVAAVLVPFFGGQEMGPAVADILFGVVDPGGRLPITFPVALQDTPSWSGYAPVDQTQVYREGSLMGYRGYDRHPDDQRVTEPLFPFGHGLSYGECVWGLPEVNASTISIGELEDGQTLDVTVPLQSVGTRSATVVVQGYVAPIDPPVDRPVKELRAFCKVVVDASESVEISLSFAYKSFRRWDESGDCWVVDPGFYNLVCASSAGDEGQRLRIEITS